MKIIQSSKLFAFSANKASAIQQKTLIQKQIFYNVPQTFSGIVKSQFQLNADIPSDVKQFNLSNINIKNYPDTKGFDNIPKLQHNLSKLLDGKIHSSKNVLNKLPPVDKQLIQKISQYTQPSRDDILLNITNKQKCKYSSSTSNISIPLIHLYFIFSMFRRPNFNNIFDQFSHIKRQHMSHFKKPSTFYLTKKVIEGNTIYSINSQKGYSQEMLNQILMDVGHLAEYALTTPPQMLNSKVVKKQTNYYRYCLVNNNLILRSQIDCKEYDENGQPFVFQIKTRANAPIRYDVLNWRDYLQYPIHKLKGYSESFQREYYDLVRGGFLKYAMQLKIGKMSGAFIAYHNTEDIYGYQFVKMQEIVNRLFGDQYNMQLSFGVVSKMLTEILDYVLEQTRQYSYENLKIGFYANQSTKSLNLIVQVMSQVKSYGTTLTYENIQKYFDTHVSQLKNPVFKYDISFYTLLNGTLVRYPEIYFRPSDNISMKWKVRKYGRIQRDQYILFLREAYKEEYVFGENRYSGYWSTLSKIPKF